MQALKDRLEIPDIVRVEPGNGSLPKLSISTKFAHAEIYLHGAHVTAFQPAGQRPILWTSGSSYFESGKPIRGGVPICFPWFGPKAGDAGAPAHGFARTREWQVESVVHGPGGEVVATFLLESDDATRALWPVDFALRHIVKVGRSLEMTLRFENRSSGPARFEEALHSYFTVSDIKAISIAGIAPGTKYLDKVGGLSTRQQDDARIRFTGETDRVYLNTTSTCIIEDPTLARRIEIAKSNSGATVVWNPWIEKARAMKDFGDDEWPGMVCVETCNVADHAIQVAPAGFHEMTARIGIA